MPKLGIVVSHPIQYYTPLFRFLARHIDMEVFYCFRPTAQQVGQSGFGIALDWGIDLLEGHPYRFINNVAAKPSTDNFSGIDTPDIGAELASAKVTHVLVMGWQLKSYWQTFAYCLRHGIPVGVRGDSQINHAEPRIKSIVRSMIYPLFLRRYRKIFYVGKRNKQYLLKNGARPAQLLFSPHAVDRDFWKPKGTGLHDNSVLRFLWVAKFIPKKRPQDAIRAFREALKKRANMELLMVGTGELLQDCRSLAAEEPRIQFLGFRNQLELREIYGAGDCLLLTSDAGETWGLVVNEAMSMGLPAIVSNTCGCSEDLVSNGKTGFSYQLADIVELTNHILQVADILLRDRTYFIPYLEEKLSQYSFAGTLDAVEKFINED